MPIIARISAIWSRQKLLVAVFFVAVSAWFYVDGAIRYPRSNMRLTEYRGYKTAGHTEAEWSAYAASKGWVAQPPEKYFGPGEIIEQYVIGGILTAVGVLLFVYWLTQRKRELKLEDGAVFTPSGARVPFSAIRGVGKKRWDTKGIAVVRYEDNGRLLQFLVDDYKYETEPARQILDHIEQQLTSRENSAA